MHETEYIFREFLQREMDDGGQDCLLVSRTGKRHALRAIVKKVAKSPARAAMVRLGPPLTLASKPREQPSVSRTTTIVANFQTWKMPQVPSPGTIHHTTTPKLGHIQQES